MGTLSEMMARQRAAAEADAKKGIANEQNVKSKPLGNDGGAADIQSVDASESASDRSDAREAPASTSDDSGNSRPRLSFLGRSAATNSPRGKLTHEQGTQTVSAQQPVDNAVSSATVLPDSDQSKQVPQPAADDAPAPDRKPRLGFLGSKGGGVSNQQVDGPTDSGDRGSDSPAAPGLARLAGLQSGAHGGAVSEQGGNSPADSIDIPASGLSLADLDNFEGSGVVEFRPQYSDEIPATAPTRELPEDITESQQGFVMLLNGIYSVLYDPELFGQMVRNIMSELQENPEYEKLLADEDVNAMMRGLRESMGMAKIKKAEKTKGGGRTGKAQSVKASAVASTIDSMFDDGDFD